MTKTTAKYGIIGHPLGHTLSPALHNWGFARFSLDAHYEAWPTPPEKLGEFMDRFRKEHIRGLSVTIPHKLAVMEHVDVVTERATAVGAVNTLWWNGTTLMGDNTDMAGIMAPVAALSDLPASGLVLGAGGAARAAVAALSSLGIRDVAISNRTRGKAVAIARDFGLRVVDWERRGEQKFDLLLNSTPLGMQGEMADRTPYEKQWFRPGMTVFDLVYTPLRTRLLREAEAAGCTVLEGLEMFVHQGLEQFRLWTGKTMDEQGARKVLLEALGHSA